MRDGIIQLRKGDTVFRVGHASLQYAMQQLDRLQRLTEVVAGSGQEARPGQIGALRRIFRRAQQFLGLLLRTQIVNGCYHHRSLLGRDRSKADIERDHRAVLGYAADVQSEPHRSPDRVGKVVRMQCGVSIAHR